MGFHEEYRAMCAKRSEERAIEHERRRKALEKSERKYKARRQTREANEKKGCEHELKLAPGSITRFDATVDGGGHFTGVTVHYHGGSRWIYTGRSIGDLHARWERLGERLANRKQKRSKKS